MSNRAILCAAIGVLAMFALGWATGYVQIQDGDAVQKRPLVLEEGIEEADLTTENYVYIPLNLLYLPESNIGKIEETIAAWERAHPDRMVVDVDIYWRQTATGAMNKTDGFSIYSRLRECGCPCPE